MFPVIVNDGKTPFPDDDIFYIVCKEGIYLKKKLGVMESIAPVKNISILKSIQTQAKMHVKKIPATKAQQVINFFKEVYNEYRSEAIVLLFYNLNKGHYKIIAPPQKVSGAGAEYTKDVIIENYDMIGTIHSHANMSAFHSSIDDSDEKSFDGLHITFGDMGDDDISISASIVANGFRVMVDPLDYINKLVKTVDVDEEEKVQYGKSWTWDKDKKKMVEVDTGKKYYTRKRFDQRFSINLTKGVQFPKSWMASVEKKTYAGFYNGMYPGMYHGFNSKNKKTPYGVSSYWKNWHGHNTTGNIPKIVKSTRVIPKATTSEDIIKQLDSLDEKTRATVIKWAVAEMEEDERLVSEALGEDVSHYECIKCQLKFSADESKGKVVCSKCGTDDYLIEINATELLEEMPDIPIEEINDDRIHCKSCGSSFTKDFMFSGECPMCGTILDPEAKGQTGWDFIDKLESEAYIQCPECARSFSKSTLNDEHKCPFCYNEIGLFEVEQDVPHIGNGDYLDPDFEKINESNIERIAIPDQEVIPINKKENSRKFLSFLKKIKRVKK